MLLRLLCEEEVKHRRGRTFMYAKTVACDLDLGEETENPNGIAWLELRSRRQELPQSVSMLADLTSFNRTNVWTYVQKSVCAGVKHCVKG